MFSENRFPKCLLHCSKILSLRKETLAGIGNGFILSYPTQYYSLGILRNKSINHKDFVRDTFDSSAVTKCDFHQSFSIYPFEIL